MVTTTTLLERTIVDIGFFGTFGSLMAVALLMALAYDFVNKRWDHVNGGWGG